VRVAFRPFAFVPSIEPLAPDPELAHVEAAIAQELPAIRRAMAVYATRLSTLRARAAGAAATAIPDVGALLDGAAADLRREQVAFTDEDGSETVVTIDETAGLAPAGAPALLAQAHADWAALAWLCWAVGLDAVAQPAVVRPRPALATAMRLAVTRAWRLRDQLTTGGLLARTNGVPGFEWQGQDVDALPAHLAEMAAQEYVAVRAMFLWLASPDASSPFQDDLQDA